MSALAASNAYGADGASTHSQAKVVPAIGIALVALGVVLLSVGYVMCILIAVAMVMAWEQLSMIGGHNISLLAGREGRWYDFFSLIELALITSFGLWIVWLHQEAGAELLAIVIFCTYFSDVAALYGGQYLSTRKGRLTQKLRLSAKLAPRVSPNKTVVGVICGLVASLLLASIIGMIFGAHHGMMLLLVSVAIFTLIGVSGDLTESHLKRLSGVKDSGHLLAGHGGFLDRNDALMVSSMAAYGLFVIHWF